MTLRSANSQQLRQALLFILWAGLALFVGYALMGHSVVSDAYSGKSISFFNKALESRGEHSLEFYQKKADYLIYFLGTGWITALTVLMRLLRAPSAVERRFIDSLLFLQVASLFWSYFLSHGTERHWYVIQEIMTFTGHPPYQHRVLFVGLAHALRTLSPSLTYHESYLMSQMAAIVLALWAVRRLAGLFISRDLTFIAPCLALLMYAPTLDYFTFYDIGIIFVYSFCLYHLYRRDFIPYTLMFAVGTYNHELTLFLVVTSACVFIGRMKPGHLAGFLILQLAVYAGVRSTLFFFLPTTHLWDGGKVAYNSGLFFEHPRTLFMNLYQPVFWYVLAAFGLPHAPPALRRSLIILPCLLVMTFFVGQFNESRQFDAFIPVAVMLMVSWIAFRVGMVPAERDSRVA